VAGLYEDGALLLPKGDNFKYRFMWVDRVRRMFTWPKFFPESHVNRELNGYHNRQILDNGELLVGELLAYIRYHMHVTYNVAGVEDRNLRLAHCKKLADRFLTEKGWDKDKMNPLQVNAILHTVQVAADNAENRMLLQENNPSYNLGFVPTLPHTSQLVMAAPIVISMLHPSLRRKLYSVVLKPLLSYVRRHVQASVEILLTGSVLSLKQVLSLTQNLLKYTMCLISKLSTYQWLNQNLLLLWRIVRTMCMRVCISAISKLRPNIGANLLMSAWSSASLQI
jgi:hypothetical protein